MELFAIMFILWIFNASKDDGYTDYTPKRKAQKIKEIIEEERKILKEFGRL